MLNLLDSTLEGQLEAEAIHSNKQLLDFQVRSKNINWKDFIEPLRERGSAVYLAHHFNLMTNNREPVNDGNRRKVLVCHDMMGNYLDDKHFHCSKKFDYYRFYHWSAVDYFCYFSHNYITIPPCGWINAAHKHGVRVLGTFITEGYKGGILLEEVLASKAKVDKIVEALVKLCTHFIFDGWLVNIECRVPLGMMENLYYFINELRANVASTVKDGVVFWYDSVVENGQLSWQNEVNAKNVRFLHLSNGMLINYNWNDRSLVGTGIVCDQERIPRQGVYFGIDIFGRGQVAKFQSKKTLARITQERFSAGLFAPGWTYETLQQYGYNIKVPIGLDDVNEAFLLRNDKFWWLLWDNFATYPYHELPFYTNFCLGSGKQFYVHGKPHSKHSSRTLLGNSVESFDESSERFFNLSRQSLQPSVPLHQLAKRCYDDAFHGGSCLQLLAYDTNFRLFACDFLLSGKCLICSYAFKLHPRDGEFDCILRFCIDNNTNDCYLFLGDYYNSSNLQKGRCYVSPLKTKYHDQLVSSYTSANLPLKSSIERNEPNQWNIRYYVISFDTSIQIKDIGILYRRQPNALDTAYLGAIYLNEYPFESFATFPTDSNAIHVPVQKDNLLN